MIAREGLILCIKFLDNEGGFSFLGDAEAASRHVLNFSNPHWGGHFVTLKNSSKKRLNI